MWPWRTGQPEKHPHLQNGAGQADSDYRRATLAAELAGAEVGLCVPGHFEHAARPSHEKTLRRALDFFMACVAPEETSDSWSINRSLLSYLRGVHDMPFLLTVGWYEFGGRPVLQHTRDVAEGAARAPEASPARRAVHTWVTSRAFEIVDVSMPRILEPAIRHSDDRNLAFYFRAPTSTDQLVYHPTLIVDGDPSQADRPSPRTLPPVSHGLAT